MFARHSQMATDEGKLTAILLDMFKDVPSPTKSVRPIFSEPSTMRMWIGGLPKGVCNYIYLQFTTGGSR